MSEKIRHYIFIICVTIMLIGITILIGLIGYTKMHDQKSIFSKQILSQANFTIFYPADTSEIPTSWKLQNERTSYDKESGVLTMHAYQASTGREMILNEQPTPGTFSDVPTQYNKMLNSLNEYNELQLGFGSVALTRPKELGGGQSAVANKAGTLIFAKPSENLTDDDWRVFFESLKVLRS